MPLLHLLPSELAKLNGATAEEIEDAVHFAKSSAGWSTYLTGMQADLEEFKQDIRQACDYARHKQMAGVR